MNYITYLPIVLLFANFSQVNAWDERPPNIVLIMADDMGFECLNCYGGKSYVTPNLNRIAEQGVRFNHCYSTPICTPSRVQLMTGKYSFRNYEAFAYLNPADRTIGHLMNDAGYATMIAGKWQLNGHNAQPPKPDFENKRRPLEAGFDECYVWQVDQVKTERYWGSLIVENGEDKQLNQDQYTPDYLVEKICDFMSRKKDEPFFVYYPMLLTHAPFVRTPDSKPGKPGQHEAFSDMVAYTDKIVGQIETKIAELGLAENTILIFTGDNGTDKRISSQLDERNITGGKGTTLDTGTHVPLICKWEGRIKGVVSDRLIDFTDFYPTFSEAMNNSSDTQTPKDGVSFLADILGLKGVQREWIFCHYDPRWGNHQAAQFARNRKYKLYADGRFIDVERDLFEQQPLKIDQLANDAKISYAKLGDVHASMPDLPVESLISGPRIDHKHSKPNIVLLMADDLGWGDVGFNGNKTIRTPNLDEMAKSGLKFNRFYSAAPVCSPTRGSCLTGRHPYRYGIRGANSGHLRKEEFTLAEFLKQHGYRSGHFGKWHLGTLTDDFSGKGPSRNPKQNFLTPDMAGFDYWFSTEYAVATWDPYDPENAHEKKNAGDPRVLYWENGKNLVEPLKGDDSRIIVDRVLPFIDDCTAAETPFLTVVWFHAPHKPVVAGPKYKAMYQDYPDGAQHFFGCITAMDEQIGRLRKHLSDKGILDNTLICFCSDNGPEGSKAGVGTDWGSAGELRGRKRSLYEGGVRVPGIIEWSSRIAPGSQTDVPCVTSDYFSTIVEIVGGKRSDIENTDGLSLVRIFDGRLEIRPHPIGFQSGDMQAWIDNQFKLVVSNKGTVTELFDIVNDPQEALDLAEQHPDRVRRMRDELERWRKSCETSSQIEK